MRRATTRNRLRPVTQAIRQLGAASPLIAVSLLASNACAYDFSSDDSDLKFRWDNTLRYSAAFRAKKANPVLLTNVNQDDGDRNFNTGLVSNRIDLFSEADLTYKKFGARISGAAYYDQIYNRTNDNNSPNTVNSVSVSSNEFTVATRDLAGRKAEILDAFVFGSGSVADFGVSGRLGKHTVLWGESLFFGNNGIAGTQAAVDIIKAVSAPGSTFKEIIRPDNQISGQVQIASNFSFSSYYKFAWERSRLPPAGSYFSNGDLVNGGERVFQGPFSLYRTGDFKPKESGQYGFSFKWRPTGTDLDFGIYAINYHDRNPNIYLLTPPGPGLNGRYNLAYAKDVKAFGLSANASIGEFSLAGEASIRHNAPLSTDPQAVFTSGPVQGVDYPRFAKGHTAHVNLSLLWNVTPYFLAQESSFAGEVAWNRTTSVTDNPNALAYFSRRDAYGLRFVYTPTYRQVMPGLDLSVPVSLGYFPEGRSSAVPGFGVNKGGDYSVGLTGAYLDVWRFSLAYTAFYGPPGTFLRARPGTGTQPLVLSYNQSLKDRSFVAFSLSRTL